MSEIPTDPAAREKWLAECKETYGKATWLGQTMRSLVATVRAQDAELAALRRRVETLTTAATYAKDNLYASSCDDAYVNCARKLLRTALADATERRRPMSAPETTIALEELKRLLEERERTYLAGGEEYRRINNRLASAVPALLARLEKAEAVAEAAENFTSVYTTTRHGVLHAKVRDSLAAWRAARGGEGEAGHGKEQR